MVHHALRHDVTIDATLSDLETLLTTRDGLAKWVRASVAENAGGDGWTISYPDGPRFEWRAATDGAHTTTWNCLSGPGDAAGTSVTFALDERPDGRTALHFAHGGWPHQEGNFAKCNALWGMLLHSLKDAAETGRSAPHYS